MITQISMRIAELINNRLELRNAKGYETYGETLDDVPFENYDWNTMMNEELLDALQYAIKENFRLSQQVKELREKVDNKVFEEDVWRTFNKKLNGHERLNNAILGILGEGGEVADIFKKVWYQGHLLNPDEVKDELGDLLYYVTLLASLMDSSLDEIMTLNMIKRGKRYPAGFDKMRSVNRDE